MNDVRILHVFKYFRPQFTGEGIFLERLAPIFRRLRSDVQHEVLVTATVEPAEPIHSNHFAAVYYLSGREAAGPLDIAVWLVRHGQKYRVVHFHTHVDRTFLGCLGLKLQTRRLVLSATLDDSVAGLVATYRPLLRPFVRLLFRLVDRFVAISPKLFDENCRLVPPSKAVLAPMGVPIPPNDPDARASARKAQDIPPHVTVLVSVGGICERKDQIFLVQQLPELVSQDPTILLVLVGPVLETDYFQLIQSYISENRLQSHVRFAGFAEQPSAFYSAADIMVFASRQEGFGTVVIEAMAHGLPVVARRLPGVNDAVIVPFRTGYLFDAADDYRAIVGDLLRDEDARLRVGSAARRLVATNYDIVDIAEMYLKIYGFPPETVARGRA
jgi:glycosyltransferase involved in cell wall biosynthesis